MRTVKIRFLTIFALLHFGITVLASQNMADDNFSFVSGASVASYGTTQYLHLLGQVDEEPKKLLEEVKKNFLRPLQEHRTDVIFSYVARASGPGNIVLNMVIEPISEAGNRFLQAYIERLEIDGFRKLTVKFHQVDRLFETSLLRIGFYKADRTDPFVQKHELASSFAFSSLSQWLTYNNFLGRSIRSPRHEDFIAYIKQFAKTPDRLKEIRQRYLAQHDYVRVFNLTYFILADGSVTEPHLTDSPFLPWFYNRNCASSRHEGGACD